MLGLPRHPITYSLLAELYNFLPLYEINCDLPDLKDTHQRPITQTFIVQLLTGNMVNQFVCTKDW